VFTECLETIRKRLWLIILLPLAAAATAFLCSNYLLKPVYEANTTLYINNSVSGTAASVNTDDMVARQYLVKDYMELIKSRAVILSVIEALKLSQNADELAKKIVVDSKNNTSLIEITVSDQDPQVCMEIANKIGNVMFQKITPLIGFNNVSIVDVAVIPSTPTSPNMKINVCAAFLAALITAFFISFTAEYFDHKIKTQNDVEKYLKLKVLGVVPVPNKTR